MNMTLSQQDAAYQLMMKQGSDELRDRVLAELIQRGREERQAPKRQRDYSADRQLYMRTRYLPRQIEAARHKVRALENEALRYGLKDLVR